MVIELIETDSLLLWFTSSNQITEAFIFRACFTERAHFHCVEIRLTFRLNLLALPTVILSHYFVFATI